MSDYNSNQNSYQDRPKPVKTILDHYGMKLSTKPQAGSQRKPTLAVRIYDNQPMFVVYTNVEGDKENGKIEASTDTPTFFYVLKLLKDMIAGPVDNRRTIEIKKRKFQAGGRLSDQAILDSKIVVGKDKDGIVYIGVTSWDGSRPQIRFPFKLSENSIPYRTVNGNAERIPDDEISAGVATSYVTYMEEIAAQMLRTQYVDKPRKNQQGGNGGGGGSYNNQGQRPNYQQRQQESSSFTEDTFGDDIPL